MGTWGNKIYDDDDDDDDDDAQDARDSYKELLAKGLDGVAATDQFLKVWKQSLRDSDDGPIIWLALADTQWRLGRLEDVVRDKASRSLTTARRSIAGTKRGRKQLPADRKSWTA